MARGVALGQPEQEPDGLSVAALSLSVVSLALSVGLTREDAAEWMELHGAEMLPSSIPGAWELVDSMSEYASAKAARNLKAEPRSVVGGVTMDPDCFNGKHLACSGKGWDEEADELAACPCECHSRRVA